MALTGCLSKAHLGHTLPPKEASLEDERKQTTILTHICDFFQKQMPGKKIFKRLNFL